MGAYVCQKTCTRPFTAAVFLHTKDGILYDSIYARFKIKQTKLICGNKYQNGGDFGWLQLLKRAIKKLGIVQYLDWDAMYTPVYRYKNLL